MTDFIGLKAVFWCANQQNGSGFRSPQSSPFKLCSLTSTPAVTQWPRSQCEEGYRLELVDWLARTPLISPLAARLPVDTCRPVPMPKHKFTFIWKEAGERYMQDKSCCISTVQCQGLSTVQDSHTNGLWRAKFSLEEQLKGSHRVHSVPLWNK